MKAEFDPLSDAIWPSNEAEEETLWKPVQAAIEKGPADNKKIDDLKTSMLAEARTSYQQVTFETFTQLEHALFSEAAMLADAVKNADDVDGSLKVRAWVAVLQSILIVLQVGTMFAPALAQRKRFIWGGIAFLNFDRAVEDMDSDPQEAMISVITSLSGAIVSKTAQDYGSTKMNLIFKEVSRRNDLQAFVEVLNFACIATARGKGWAEALTTQIEKVDKNAYYLSAMLNQLMVLLSYELMSGRDRQLMKRLVALIQTKRSFGKKNPGAKAVSKMIRMLEDDSYFPEHKVQPGSDVQ